jgi:Uma2 family endonuclease
MNVQARLPTTADEFLAWNEGREGKREFVKGRVVEMMINVSRNHARLAARLTLQLLTQLDERAFDVGSADFAIRTHDGVRFPDVFVDRIVSESDGTDLSARSPIFLAEILSASSYSRDFGEKVEDYSSLQSVRHYLVLSQDEPRAWLWSRDAAGRWTGPEMFHGAEAKIELAGLGVTVDLVRLYAGIAAS